MSLKNLLNSIIQYCFLFLTMSVFSLNTYACEGLYKGQCVSNEQLHIIFAEHNIWLERSEKLQAEGKKVDFNDKQRANLCGADLSHLQLHSVILSHADLREVNFNGAELNSANLHESWLDDANLSNTDLTDANLSNAFLYGANMSQSKLHRTDLTESKMQNVDLSDSELEDTQLKNTELERAQLNYAHFNNADLTNAKLNHADLRHAKLLYTDMTNANLQHADLSYAYIVETVMTDVLLYNAELTQVFYFPKVGTYPDISEFTQAKNYKTMIYYDERIGISPGMFALRAAYESANMEQMERLFTYLIQSKEQSEGWKKGGWERFISVMTWILFDLPTKFGFCPQQPIKILFSLIIIFWIVYWISLRMGLKGASLNIVWPSSIPSKETIYYKRLKFFKSQRLQDNIRLEITFMRVALHLSILSAFRLGWRDFNIGVWLSYLQFHDYSLVVHKGWLRSLCGLQSLISTYMVASWAMTQFGRPFG